MYRCTWSSGIVIILAVVLLFEIGNKEFNRKHEPVRTVSTNIVYAMPDSRARYPMRATVLPLCGYVHVGSKRERERHNVPTIRARFHVVISRQ
jgi:hypothetical protein